MDIAHKPTCLEISRLPVRWTAGIALAFFVLPHLKAEESQETQAENLPLITVTAPRLSRDLYSTPAAVSTLDRRDLQQGQQGIRLDESLEQVPGLFLQNRDNFAQGQRISSRGFGARAPFGIRGLFIRVDGVPYTLPDGQSQIDAVDLAGAETVEVIRGPSSVLYGNAAGGVLDITTADGRQTVTSPVFGAQLGSDGLRQYQARAGGESGRWFYEGSVSALTADGYRDQSEVEKYQFNSRLGYRLDDQRTVSGLINLLELPKAQDPGGLTREEAAANPQQAAPAASALNAGQKVDQQLAALRYQDLDFGGGDIAVSGFYSERDFEQQLPFPGSSLVDYRRRFYGGSVEFGRDSHLGPWLLRTVYGVDVAWQDDHRGRRSVNPQGDITAVTADERQQAQSTGVFAQGDLALTETLSVTAGVRHDRVVLDVNDDFFADGQDDSGRRVFREWSGSLGISYRLLPRHQLYATLGNAFETPTFTEFARPDGGGGFNPAIEPQQALNRELGIRGYYANGLSYDLALFSVRVRDELVPFEENNRTFYRNAGRTSRDGLELGLDYEASPSWRYTSALTLARYRFDRFEDDGEQRAGNHLPGLPTVIWHSSARWSGLGGRFARFDGHYTGSYYADNANEEKAGHHWRFDARTGDRWLLAGGTTLEIYAGVRNLADESHFENVRINANGGRYYEPAAGRTWFAGFELGF
ncbi:TonB-dependent receptor [uncultured Marinobacter sp.]|uniref:TonB-dependent receptor family protein n=1 Tax=uncultured Marinobacter sp. TaxID=187379 RepID=UPI0030DAB8E4